MRANVSPNVLCKAIEYCKNDWEVCQRQSREGGYARFDAIKAEFYGDYKFMLNITHFAESINISMKDYQRLCIILEEK